MKASRLEWNSLKYIQWSKPKTLRDLMMLREEKVERMQLFFRLPWMMLWSYKRVSILQRSMTIFLTDLGSVFK